ncbi:Dps family protein [Pontibacter sp. MBLB2868]|uniref:Dps family protein n=1 Tax=Pontibacter sp. MBLB2868 TaxID=3451555 RepID=UPI003F74D53A
MAKNLIGIDTEKAAELADKLNLLLSNYQLFYINARGFHWNIAGEKFFELHVKFEELYNDAFLKIDEIAERILTLGQRPFHTYTTYLEHATIKEISDVSEGRKAIEEVLKGFSVLITAERELLELAAEANDEGTNALMSDYIREQEKLVWMYSAYLNR